MRKSKTLFIRFEAWETFMDRVQTALETRQPSIGRKDTLIFGSVMAYQKFMTEQKLAILATIISQNPTSIYQLAQLVDRDFANVQRDCTALANMGFIRLEESDDAKGSKIPRLAFDYNRIVVQMPKATYAHDFGFAA